MSDCKCEKVPTQQERVRKIMWDHLKTVKQLDDKIVAVDAIGPCLVIAGDPPMPGYGWFLAVSLHNNLIGQDDHVVTIPLTGVLPIEDHIKMGAEKLLTAAREEKEKVQSLPPKPTPDGDIPAGLRGKRLGIPT